jgi:hypothetical protein
MWTDRASGAPRLLGDDHPLSEAERSMSALKRQAVVCLALGLGSPAVLVAVDRASAVALLVAATAVEAGLCAGIGVMRTVRRDRIHDMIIVGTIPDLAVVAAELHRLAGGHRHKLAASLERALHDGEHWHEFLPAARPPYGVRNLPAHAATIREIAAALRGDRPSIRGVVLVERLLSGGFGSAVYNGDAAWLASELNRIRYELAAGSPRSAQVRDAALRPRRPARA